VHSVQAIANHAPLTSFALLVTRVGTWTAMLARCVPRIVKRTYAPRLAGALLVSRVFTSSTKVARHVRQIVKHAPMTPHALLVTRLIS
jgi:hypothetical protein